MKIKSSFLNINNKQLEYLTYGNFSDDSPVLILLHEGLGSVAMLRQIPQLIYEKTNLNVIVYSRFGYGRSSNSELPRPLNYMTIEAEKYLPILIQKLKIKKFC